MEYQEYAHEEGLGATEPTDYPPDTFGGPHSRDGFRSSNHTMPPFISPNSYPMVPPTKMSCDFPMNATVKPIEPKRDKNGLNVLEIPSKQRMTLPEVDMSFPPKFPTITHQSSHENEIFVKPNLQYIDQELHPLYVQTQNLITDLNKERLKRVEEDNKRQMSMAQMQLEQRKARDRFEADYR
jgi:hypothetical protein